MLSWAILLTVCIWILAATAGQLAPPCASPPPPRPLVDFTIDYSLPFFQTRHPIQNIVVNLDSLDREVYVASQNEVKRVSSTLEEVWKIKTGPFGSLDCKTCNLCNLEPDPEDPINTDNEVLLLDLAVFPSPYLYFCGSTQRGICYFIDIGETEPEPKCLYRKEHNSLTLCPDCVASPLGTVITIVDQGATSYFYTASSINKNVASIYPRRSISVLRPLATEDGFEMTMTGLTVLPNFQDSYKIEYIYSFSTKDYVYFLSVQRENPGSSNSAFQTRLGRLPVLIPEVWMYREVVLECQYNSKRRRRKTGSENPKYVVYNGLQAAHLGKAGPDLAQELRLNRDEDILFGVFAQVDLEGRRKRTSSALCVFPMRKVNQDIDQGVEACCKPGPERLSRGLSHFQPLENCLHEVSNPFLFLFFFSC